MTNNTPTVSQWLRSLEQPGPDELQKLRDVYGNDADVLRLRTRLLCRVLCRFLKRFGDTPVRLFRSPGRINLRGMHVDTHGGYLNLMTHQREIVIACAPAEDDACTFCNDDPEFAETSFRINELASHPAFPGSWLDYITHPDVTASLRKGHWSNYVRGAMLRARRAVPKSAMRGLHAAIASDLPRGAALTLRMRSARPRCLPPLPGTASR